MNGQTLFAFNLTIRDPLVFAGALHDRPYTLFFDSADRSHPLARYSFIAFSPFETLESKNGRLTVTAGGKTSSLAGNPFHVLQQRLATWGGPFRQRADLPPFQGGVAGCFGYDLARQVERLPSSARDDRAIPDMMVGLYDQVLAFDHVKDKAWFITHAPNEDTARTRMADVRKLAESSIPAPHNTQALHFNPDLSREEYESRIARVIRYVHAGDIFQANLSQRFTADVPEGFNPFVHYLRLREINAAPFAAYMRFSHTTLCSASPERFLHVADRRVETRPIKGTRLRHADAMLDSGIRAALLASAKDRAENAMIVDLLRNDLSRVCMDHSIDAPVLCQLESFARVHHLVSVVTGTLSADRTAVDLLRACFPGGSVTGAPKIRAMEIIEELEDHRRGPYCGALGYIGFNGAMDTSIAIRTLVYKDQTATFNVGGGIVAESDPGQEYQETLDKAEGLLKSF